MLAASFCPFASDPCHHMPWHNGRVHFGRQGRLAHSQCDAPISLNNNAQRHEWTIPRRVETPTASVGIGSGTIPIEARGLPPTEWAVEQRDRIHCLLVQEQQVSEMPHPLWIRPSRKLLQHREDDNARFVKQVGDLHSAGETPFCEVLIFRSSALLGTTDRAANKSKQFVVIEAVERGMAILDIEPTDKGVDGGHELLRQPSASPVTYGKQNLPVGIQQSIKVTLWAALPSLQILGKRSSLWMGAAERAVEPEYERFHVGRLAPLANL